MTGGDPEAPAHSSPGESPPTDPEIPRPHAPGIFRFSLEGRHAPALFVGGWIGTVLGGGLTLVGLLGGAGTGAAVLLLLGLAILSVGLVLLGGSQAIERRAAGEPYPGPSPILLFVAIVAVTLVVAGVVGTVLSLAGVRLPDSERPLGDLISVVIQGVVFVGMVRLLVVGTGAISWAEMGLMLPPRRIPGMVLLGAAVALPVIVLTGLVAGAILPFIPEVPPSPLPPTGTASGIVLHLLAGAVVAPIAEETVFRGAMLTAWARGAGVTSAIVRSAVLFALAHALTISADTFSQAAGLAVVATVARIPVALALGWVYARTGTLWASIGLHATFNGILIVLSEIGLAAPTAVFLLTR